MHAKKMSMMTIWQKEPLILKWSWSLSDDHDDGFVVKEQEEAVKSRDQSRDETLELASQVY